MLVNEHLESYLKINLFKRKICLCYLTPFLGGYVEAHVYIDIEVFILEIQAEMLDRVCQN